MKKIKIFLVLLLFVISYYASGQINQQTEKLSPTQQTTNLTPNVLPKINADAFQLLSEINTQGIITSTIPVEGTIDADKYIVGQGDIFTLGLYGFINQLLPVPVNLEGSVVVPTVGEIKIAGLTLKEAKEKVISAVKKRYYTSTVSFTLSNPRTFLVQVTGLTQGTYPVTGLTRPSQLLSAIIFDTLNVSKKIELSLKNAKDIPNPVSLRNIELRRKDGSVQRVDIYKFFYTKDDRYNPPFLEGDLLKIPNTYLGRNCITVEGAVQLGGIYEYAPDDNLESAIALARGFDADAEPDSIVVYRPYGKTEGFKEYYLSYERDKNFKIEVFDRVFVKYKTNYQKTITCRVLGEVVRPGLYPITFKQTRLRDVIEMAGGFTKNAYLPLCIVFRNYDEEYTLKDTMEIIINKRASDFIVTEQDKLNFMEDVRGRRNRVIVDFEKLFLENDESQNIIIEDKDIIYVNDDKKFVYVYGQVQAEGYVAFKEGADVEYYIEKAGGYTLAADKSNTRIIRFNTRGWYKPGDVAVRSGDFIYVPKVVERPFPEIVNIISQIASVVLGVITTYILIRNTQK